MKHTAIAIATLLSCFINNSSASVIYLDFSQYNSNSKVTDQFDSLGVRFLPYYNSFFLVFGGVPNDHGGYDMGITNYTDPSPGATNGIIIWFDSPIDYIRFDLSANRVGSPGIVNAYSDNSTLLFTDSFNSFDFYKGTYERTFTENVNSIVVYSASPNYTPVGIRNFEFELKPSAPIPEPASIALVLIGMAGLVAVRKPA